MIVDDTNTHWALIYRPGSIEPFRLPKLLLIGQGTEESCWQALDSWTERRPLREGEVARVLVDTAVLSHAW